MFDPGYLITIVESVVVLWLIFWFYSTLKKILKTLEDIKELLQGGKASGNRSEEQYR